MKYLMAVCYFLCFVPVFAQKKSPSVVTRTQTIKMVYQNDHEELRLPMINEQYPALKAALCDTALLEGSSIDSVKKGFETQGFGITSFDYKISYQNPKVISFIFYYETMGAHPDSYQTYNTYVIETGKHFDLASEYTSAGMNYIFNSFRAVFKRKLQYWKNPHIRRDSLERADKEIVIDALQDYIKSIKPADVFRNYVFTPKGIRFSSGDILPHAFRGLDPGTEVLIAYDKLKPYRKKAALAY